MRVLVVDDNRLITYLITKYVKAHYAADIVTSNNGQDGLSTFKKFKFDLVITDCHMPVLEGYEMVERMRLVDREVKIIAYTVFDDDIHRDLMDKAGVDRFLVKDGDTKELLDVIGEYFPGRSQSME
jgi:two-component system response regulator VanR